MTIIDEIAVVMDQNIRGVQFGLYSTAVLGLAIALRSVRPFKKFTTPQSIPSSFVRKHLTLYGRVMEVEPSGALQVDHFPIWSLLSRRPSLLQVKIDSIETKGLSTAWLQTVVKGDQIEFQPITVEDNSLSCIVVRKKKNVGIQLVSLGFASVEPIHIPRLESKVYLKYYKELLKAEDEAERKKLGIWAE